MFLGPYQELIGVKICDEVNTSKESKQTTFHSLEPPIRFSDLSMLLGIFRFYDLWIPFLGVQVFPWQVLLKRGHGKGASEAVQY